MERQIWQESAGNNERIYVDVCLRFSVILNGPGGFGSWPDCKDALIEYGERIKISKEKKTQDLRRFAEDMKEGDIVILRTGTNLVHAVGIISGKYIWNELFSDVDGWDLQHVRRVKWVWDKSLNGGKPKVFPTNSLKQGDTTQLLVIISLIVIISLVSIPVVIYAYNTIRNLLNYDPELPCEDLPDIETVRQIVEDHQDVIQEIENTNPNIPERMSSENSFFYPPSSRKLFVI